VNRAAFHPNCHHQVTAQAHWAVRNVLESGAEVPSTAPVLWGGGDSDIIFSYPTS